MKKQTKYLSKNGRTKINSVLYLPEKEPKAILQIIHGMIEHIGRYDEFARFMERQGYLVAGHDHLGHGKSVNTKDEWGYFSKDDPSDTLVKDIHQLRVNIRKKYPNLPYFMLGHSMGSYLLRKYLTLYGEGIDGAIILGTGFVNPGMTEFGKAVATAIAPWKGWDYRSPFVKKLTFSGSYKKYDMEGKDLKNVWLCKDAETLLSDLNDPACRFDFTLNGYLGLFDTVSYACRQKNINRIPPHLPILIASGKEDPVGDMGKGVEKFYKCCNKAGLQDVTMLLYENDRHEILHETDREMVFRDILYWIEEHHQAG